VRRELGGAPLLFLAATIACGQTAGPVRFDVTSMPVGRQPGTVQIGDVDGDGRADVLTTTDGGRSLHVLLGDGRGRFAPAPGSPVALPIAANLIALGDCDGDGKADVALTGHDSNDVQLHRGDGRGRFSPMPGSPFRLLEGVAPHNHGLVLADVNGDGALDVATSNNNGNSVSVLLGDGHGSFRPAPGSPFRVGRAPYPLAVEDFNLDGKPDIATPDVQGDTVTVLFGDGRGSFAAAPGSPYRVDHRPYSVAAARVNDDRAPDLVVSHDDISTVTVLLNDGRGRFPVSRTFDAGGRTWKVHAADFDRDGHTDLVMGLAPSSVAVFLGDGAGNFRRARGSPIGVGRGPWGIAIGDLNGDRKTDIVTANSDDGTLSLLIAR
jgi:FG-GAP-like repeat